jgi:hypothetical protein
MYNIQIISENPNSLLQNTELQMDADDSAEDKDEEIHHTLLSNEYLPELSIIYYYTC